MASEMGLCTLCYKDAMDCDCANFDKYKPYNKKINKKIFKKLLLKRGIHPFWLKKPHFSQKDLASKMATCNTILDELLSTRRTDGVVTRRLYERNPNIWVAGGFFTPYYKTEKTDADLLAEYTANQCMDVYITQIPMSFGNDISDADLKAYLKPKYLYEPNHELDEYLDNKIVREPRKSVPFFATFNNPILVNGVYVKVFFCYEPIHTILNSFALEPCKIGFRYERNGGGDWLIFGDWFREEYYPDDIVSCGHNPSEEFKNKYLIYKGFGSVAPLESFACKDPIYNTRVCLANPI